MYKLIFVDKEKCNNCHTCISVCPVKHCIDGSGTVVDVINERCIGCGVCIAACHQGARFFLDDTEQFYADLKSAVPIVAIIAPSVVAVFSDYKKIIAYLKSLGVKAVFDVSFGAELTVKSYIEYSKEKKLKTIISSACPTIVSYCSIYNPEILKYLAPAHTPMLHTAIMIQEYFKEFSDCKIAAISPCASKKIEFVLEGHIDYNVSFKKLDQHIKEHNVDLNSFVGEDFYGPKAERGVAFSIPGGMLEVLKRDMPGIHNVRSVAGTGIFNYFEKFTKLKEEAPFIIDCLNCSDGCNVGPGVIDADAPAIDLELRLENRKKDAVKFNEVHNNLNADMQKYWDKHIYRREFTDRSNVLSGLEIPSDDEINKIYINMKKTNKNDILNCPACGYGTCRGMAIAIYNKLNKPENCHHYLRVTTLEETERSNELAKEAGKASTAKSNFLATMSHEIRTPLNAIIGFSEIAMQKKLSEDVSADINMIVNSGRLLLGIVNDVLDISKIESGKIDFILTEYDTANLINDAVMINIIRIKSKPIEFKLKIDGTIPKKLFGDELRVKQIISNLLSNAFKYTRAGSVTLSLSFENDFSLDPESGILIISVTDTGIGIQKENLNTLFHEYAQLDSKANRKIEGTGLGLAITKMLIEKMGGSVSVHSEYGKGSCFTARIKQKTICSDLLEKGTIEELSSFTFDGEQGFNKFVGSSTIFPDATLLIVDDVKTNLDVAKGLLLPYKLKVDCVQSGIKAIEQIENSNTKYDLVLLDHMMPQMDGVETCRRIRQIETDYAKNIPIVAFTAEVFAGSKEKFVSAGFSDYISKPIEIMQLDSIINKYLEHKAVRKDNQIPIFGYGDFMQTTSDINESEDTITISKEQAILQENIDGIDLMSGLARFGEKNIYFDILQSFVETTPNILKTMQVINGENIKTYAINVHGIKSSSRSIGAFLLGDKAEELELSAKAGKVEFTKIGNIQFLKLAEKLIADINAFLERQNAQHKITKPEKDKPDNEILEKIKLACKEYDVNTIDNLAAELDKFVYREGGDLVKAIKEKSNLSDFEGIALLMGAYKC
ncbi:MAG: hypothetical protein Ta2B_19090 [Termitinemataceae bacterium]|nr:MAG: hypothetical protein Ta2B_19090 [Termitinemataceae bacterium]